MLHAFILLLLFCFEVQAQQQSCLQLAHSLKNTQITQIQKRQTIDKLYMQKCLISIVPKYKWAQNMSHIFVKIEFLTTTTTTPCDQILYNFQQCTDNQFFTSTVCLNSRKDIIHYELKVRTYKSLDFQYALWKKEQRNSIILECLKSPSPYFWPILHSRDIIPKRAPKIWWQKIKMYGEQLKPVIDLLELGDEDKDISKIVKNKRKKRQKQQTEVKSPESQQFCEDNMGGPEHLASWY